MPSLKCRLKKLEHQGLLSEKDLSRIYTDNDVTEELEKIKAEIKTLRYGSDTYKHAIDDVFEILDNRISELKGENK